MILRSICRPFNRFSSVRTEIIFVAVLLSAALSPALARGSAPQDDAALNKSWINEATYILRKHPNDVNSYLNRGRLFAQQGKFSDALVDFNKAIVLAPATGTCYLERGGLYFSNDQAALGFRDYNKAIQLAPSTSYFYRCRGLEYMRDGEKEKAFADFDKAVFLSPKSAIEYLVRSRAYFLFDDYKNAVRDSSVAIKLEPKQPFNLVDRALAYAELKRFDLALQDCNTAISMIPKGRFEYQYFDLYFRRALVYKLAGRIEEAIADCNKAIASEPKIIVSYGAPGARHNLGAVLEWDKMARTFVLRGDLFRGRKNFDNALKDFDRAIVISPKLAIAYKARALAYQQIGQKENADADLKAAADLESKQSAK